MLETAKRSIDCGADGIFIDEWLGTYSAVRDSDGCFCEHCMQGFRDYLNEKYSMEELESVGIENIYNFDYGNFINEQYLTTYQDKGRRGEIPLFSDFEGYQMISVREFMRDLIDNIRAYGNTKDKEIFIVANIPGMMAHWLPLQSDLDYILTEYDYDYPPEGRSIPAAKLARSLGKPLLFLQSTSLENLLGRSDMTTLMKIYTAEAYSARGFLVVPYGITARTSEGWTSYYADMEELGPYYDFMYANEQCYKNIFSTSKIAVLYPLSSAIRSGTDEFYRISDFLLNSHFQYDVLFAGDNDWMEDNLSLSQLNEYEVVILPNTCSLSDQQVNLLISYAESGGNILAFGDIGSHDEKGNEVERALLSSLLIEGSNDFGLGKFIYSGDLPTREEAGGILSGLIQPCIQTNANENVVMIEYWNNETHSIIIHLINYNYDIETQHLTSQQNIDLEVALTSELLGKELIASYESPDWTGTEELDYTVSDGRIQFQIPNLEFYGVVSIRDIGD